MVDTAIAGFTDGVTANATDRLAASRSPYNAGTDVYLMPAYIKTYITGLANTWASGQIFVAPVLGTPASGTLTNCTGLPNASVIGLGALALLATASLTANVSGILPTANGGTGIAFFTAAGPSTARVYTFPDAACSILTTNALVTGAQGGTGVANTGFTFTLAGTSAIPILTNPTSGSLQLGAADADTNAAIVAQTFRTQGLLAGGTADQAGKNWTFIASPGKGTGAGGSFIFQTTPAGSTGTTVGTPTTALTIDSTQKATFAGAVTFSNGTIILSTAPTYVTVAAASNVFQFNSFNSSGGQFGIGASSGAQFALGGSAGNFDVFMYRAAAASLQFGTADAAAPVAQTLSVQSVVAGTSNTPGANWTFGASKGTGTGVGGSLIFQVAPAGSTGTAQNALATALTIDSTKLAAFAGALSTIGTATLGNDVLKVDSSNATLWNGGGIRWANSASSGGTADLILLRDAANTLAQRNGTNAQIFRLYEDSESSNSIYSRAIIDAGSSAAGVLIFGSEHSGTTTSGTNLTKMQFNVDGTNKLDFAVTTASAWTTPSNFTSSGTIQAVTLIGTSNIVMSAGGGKVQVGANGTNTSLKAAADGILALYNDAQTDFTRLQLGGTSASFGAVARDGAGVKFVGGDGTSVSWMKVPGVAVASLPAAATAGVGACSFVTDANTTFILGLGVAVVGGGANKVPVYSDGSNWIVG